MLLIYGICVIPGFALHSLVEFIDVPAKLYISKIRAIAKAAAGEALAASLLQDHVHHFKGLLTIIKVISSILFF